jgi:D-tagatose 6-phosphate 4-epimerase
MSADFLFELPRRRANGECPAIVSICSAHSVVIEAALRSGLESRQPVLIEATCNQVNQDGGYTGMTPADFRRFVEAIAADVGFNPKNLILGGDHLGPNPWRNLPAEDALEKAEAMIAAYAASGFMKLHLDASMACRGEGAVLPDGVIARRAARLASVAEKAATAYEGRSLLAYVIGTEVPVPGGAPGAVHKLEVTTADSVRRNVDLHHAAFEKERIGDAFKRVVAIVAQPGVEFGATNVVPFDPSAASPLSAVLQQLPDFVFEAHSTDYQSADALKELAVAGFAILKVGPALTFALRQALYGLDYVAAEMDGPDAARRLYQGMEALMLLEPRHWQSHYNGNEAELRLQRHFSYADRIRYYWNHPTAAELVHDLLDRLPKFIPGPLLSQYLGHEPKGSASDPRALLLESVAAEIGRYQSAIERAARNAAERDR